MNHINAILESATNLLDPDFDSAFAEFQEILSADPESSRALQAWFDALLASGTFLLRVK